MLSHPRQRDARRLKPVRQPNRSKLKYTKPTTKHNTFWMRTQGVKTYCQDFEKRKPSKNLTDSRTQLVSPKIILRFACVYGTICHELPKVVTKRLPFQAFVHNRLFETAKAEPGFSSINKYVLCLVLKGPDIL